MENQDRTVMLHQKVLYPVVRIRAISAGGSGTVIYSQPDPHNESEYLTFVLTNQHVVDKAITTKETWDSLLQRDVKRDILSEVNIETFNYYKLSEVVSANSHQGEIMAYSKEHDLALIKLRSPHRVDYVAGLIPETRIDSIKRFDRVLATGCSLLHDPFTTDGAITYLREIIENKTYLMMSSHIIFGNSGGALFLDATGELIGVPARLTGIQLGFGVDILTWMSFAVHPSRIYEFIREQELYFLYDPNDDYYSAMKRRENKREAERRRTLQHQEANIKEEQV